MPVAHPLAPRPLPPAPRSRARALLVPLAAASLLAACAGAGGSGTRHARAADLDVEQPFPSEAQLETISQRPAPSAEQMFRDAPVPVDAWTLRGPLPDSTGVRVYEGDDALARAAAEQLGADPRARLVSEGMQCVARELGHVALVHQGLPGRDLQQFIAARCGAVVTLPAVRLWQGEVPEGTPKADAPPVEVTRGVIAEAVEATPRGANLGAWAGIEGDRWAVVVAAGIPSATIAALPIDTGAEGYVELRGALPREYGWLQGYATRGEFGFSRCEAINDMSLGPGEFAQRCRVDPRDDMAVIELVAAEPGRVLGGTALQVLVSPSGAAPNHYQLRSPGAGAVGAQDADALMTAINGLRRSLELAPLRADVEQSALVDNLLPHFLAARNDEAGGALQDQIAIGMMAGWKVNGLIRRSGVLTLSNHASRSMERVLAEALFSPSERASLLDPAARSAAVATLVDADAEAAAAMVVTYQFFEQHDYAREQVAFFDALDRARHGRGKPPVVRVGGPIAERVLGEGMQRVQRGESSPGEELDEVLGEFVERTQRGFRGTIYSTLVIDGWRPQFSEELLRAERVEVAVKIGHYRPRGGAWGQHVVFVVYSEMP